MRNITISFNDAIDMIMCFLDTKDNKMKIQAISLAQCIIRDTNISQIKTFIIEYFGGGGAWKGCAYKKKLIELFGEAILGDLE